MLCYLNGSYLAPEAAKISPWDRGFLFGDGAYEVIPVYHGHPFGLVPHLERLDRTLTALKIPNPHPVAQWQAIIEKVIANNTPEKQALYIQVSRGTDSKRVHTFPPSHVTPTVFVMSEPMSTPSATALAQGVRCITANDFRWLLCDLKTTALLGNCLLKQRSHDVGAAETILFRDENLTEASSSNVFIVKGGAIIAPPKSHMILPGITYDFVVTLAQQNGLPIEIRPVSKAEVFGADELWITSSTKEVLAVTQLDEHTIGSGKPGPVFQKMHTLYQAQVQHP